MCDRTVVSKKPLETNLKPSSILLQLSSLALPDSLSLLFNFHPTQWYETITSAPALQTGQLSAARKYEITAVNLALDWLDVSRYASNSSAVQKGLRQESITIWDSFRILLRVHRLYYGFLSGLCSLVQLYRSSSFRKRFPLFLYVTTFFFALVIICWMFETSLWAVYFSSSNTKLNVASSPTVHPGHPMRPYSSLS